MNMTIFLIIFLILVAIYLIYKVVRISMLNDYTNTFEKYTDTHLSIKNESIKVEDILDKNNFKKIEIVDEQTPNSLEVKKLNVLKKNVHSIDNVQSEKSHKVNILKNIINIIISSKRIFLSKLSNSKKEIEENILKEYNNKTK